jgi:hypothetical protein
MHALWPLFFKTSSLFRLVEIILQSGSAALFLVFQASAACIKSLYRLAHTQEGQWWTTAMAGISAVGRS